jgi:hypothetical protein
MAQTSWPFENIDTSETQFSLWARNLGQGVIEDKLFELEPFADGSGMTVKVKSGQALVRGHFYDSTVQETLNIAAADASLPRKDAVTLRLDPTVNSILLHVITGTPNASPSLPALTQTEGAIYDLLIAEINVPAAAVVISSGNVVDSRTLFSPWTGQGIGIEEVIGLTAALAAKQAVVSGVSDTEIGYLDGVTSSIQTQINTKQDIAAAVSTKTGAYTLAAGDTNDLILANGTFTISVPGNTFAVGTRVDIASTGSGTITFAGSAGLTLQSKESKLTMTKQFAGATVFFTSSTTALLIGDLA